MDQQCLRGNQPNSTRANTQGNLIRNLRTEESRPKPQKLKALAFQHQAKASEKACKEKKKKDQQFGWDRQQKGSTPANGVNAVKTGEQKKKNKDQNHSDKTTHDVSQVTYWNCNQKIHYSNACPEPSKN